MGDDNFSGSNVYGKKLQALDIALKHWGEVLMLDWDCFIFMIMYPIFIPPYIFFK